MCQTHRSARAQMCDMIHSYVWRDTRVNESCHTHKWVVSHICHAYEWGMSLIPRPPFETTRCLCYPAGCRKHGQTLSRDTHIIWVTLINESCRAHYRVIHMNESCSTHYCIIHVNESCRTYRSGHVRLLLIRAATHCSTLQHSPSLCRTSIDQCCLAAANIQYMAHIWMSHVAHMTCIWMSHGAHMTCIWMSHGAHITESHLWMSHKAHMGWLWLVGSIKL